MRSVPDAATVAIDSEPTDLVSSRLSSVRATLDELQGELSRSVRVLALLQRIVVADDAIDDALRASALQFATDAGARRTDIRLID